MIICERAWNHLLWLCATPKSNSIPFKNDGTGRRYRPFPCGFRPIFRGELLNFRGPRCPESRSNLEIYEATGCLVGRGVFPGIPQKSQRSKKTLCQSYTFTTHSPTAQPGLKNRFIFWVSISSNILCFHPRSLGKWSNLTSIFFRWVVQPPTRKKSKLTEETWNFHFGGSYAGCSPPIDTKYGKPRAFWLATVDHEVFGLIKIDVSSILFRDQCHCVGIFYPRDPITLPDDDWGVQPPPVRSSIWVPLGSTKPFSKGEPGSPGLTSSKQWNKQQMELDDVTFFHYFISLINEWSTTVGDPESPIKTQKRITRMYCKLLFFFLPVFAVENEGFGWNPLQNL